MRFRCVYRPYSDSMNPDLPDRLIQPAVEIGMSEPLSVRALVGGPLRERVTIATCWYEVRRHDRELRELLPREIVIKRTSSQ